MGQTAYAALPITIGNMLNVRFLKPHLKWT